MNDLGERIRQLRKERKMTLLDVAGKQLSKGMLSLIENGRAKPSMESLAHIANQLGVDVYVLLEERSSEEVKRLLQKTEDKIENVEILFSTLNLKEQYKNIYQDLKPIYEQKLPNTYETGRLFELGGRCLMNAEEVEEGKKLVVKSIQIFESLFLFDHALKAKIRFVYEKLATGQFEDALKMFYALHDEYMGKITVIDTIVQIELDYLELILLFSIGEYQKGKEVLDRLLRFSKRKSVFYLMDDIYRIAAFQALLNKNSEDFKLFLLKSQQFALFTDNKQTYGFSLFIEAHYHNEITKNFDQALAVLMKLDKLGPKIGAEIDGYYYLEKGKALYGKGKIEAALAQFAQFKLPIIASHPFDLAVLFTMESYRARCLYEKGCTEEARRFAKRAADKVAKLSHKTPYHTFIDETLQLVKQEPEVK
ncbi:helix-turn-helix transcriptional regulator [Bacillaceae bacterium IKA-2]|nr:helix-turn-helix transcriptional regulator [Bacillaceae bacterium IKA-2]